MREIRSNDISIGLGTLGQDGSLSNGAGGGVTIMAEAILTVEHMVVSRACSLSGYSITFFPNTWSGSGKTQPEPSRQPTTQPMGLLNRAACTSLLTT